MFKKIVSIGKTLLGELDAAVDLEVSDKQEANREVSKRLRLLNNKLASMVEKKERYVALLHNVKGWSKKGGFNRFGLTASDESWQGRILLQPEGRGGFENHLRRLRMPDFMILH